MGGEGMMDLRNRPGSRDSFLQGDCDDIFLKLLEELGWLNDIPLGKLCDASKQIVVDHLKRSGKPQHKPPKRQGGGSKTVAKKREEFARANIGGRECPVLKTEAIPTLVAPMHLL